MKRIIESEDYDTDTADCIASWDNERSGLDFKQCEESLYRTKKGAWFLVGSGGPMSKYSHPVGNMTSGGEGLEPISAKEAQKWLEDKDFTVELEQYFSDQL